eukprot:CAMPEP_0115121024 /NCGR_PEP_ID=MMETSP0227-20121206/46021_1 /TAXON_ID=89957 /ORGANISM="Polarella glacialis, Strain CCMP 1383" /LENGTH=188 /DNA_ID=CAMNT_0002522767 /DNA_START=80 /DNA_END=644 /DNA_ORIENTATION=+
MAGPGGQRKRKAEDGAAEDGEAGAAFASILGRELETTAATEAPVLVETKIAQNLKDKKSEYKEKKILAAAAKAAKDAGHEKPDIMQKNFEMQFRKHATEGVVRLFNAVRDYQAHSQDDVQKMELKKLHISKRAKVITESSKEKFEQIWKKEKDAKTKKTSQSKVKPKTEQSADGDGAEGHDQLDEFAD